MIKLSNSSLLQNFTKLLILLAIAKGISLGIWWYLPSDGVELNVKENYQPKYQRINFKNMLESSKNKALNKDTDSTDGKSTTSIDIKNMILKGLYGNSTMGYVIVALKAKPKATSVISIGEEFSGYKLKTITPSSAIFTKLGKEYSLALAKAKKTKSFIKKVEKVEVAPAQTTSISREDISYYSKNPKEIWKDISIREVKDGKKVKGFKITKIKKNSKFAALGLIKNDLIIKANNIELKSYRDAISIYKNINKIDTMQIVVIRNKQEVELVYEIN